MQAGPGPIYALGDVVPQIAPDAYVAPTAAVIGDVHVGAGSSIWFHAVLRGDINRVRVGARSNIQDGCILHVASGETFACLVGDDVTVGHGAILHACLLHDRAFVGMGATVLDGAVIETGGLLAAGGLLAPGRRIGAHQLWAGTPARFVRTLSKEDQARFRGNAERYVGQAARYRAGLRGA